MYLPFWDSWKQGTYHSGTVGNRVEVDVPVFSSDSMHIRVTPDHVLHHALHLVSCRHMHAQLAKWQVTVVTNEQKLSEVTWYGAWLYSVHRTYPDGSSFLWHQPHKNQTVQQLHHLGGYFKACCEKLHLLLFRVTCSKNAVSLLERGEQCYTKVINITSTWTMHMILPCPPLLPLLPQSLQTHAHKKSKKTWR